MKMNHDKTWIASAVIAAAFCFLFFESDEQGVDSKLKRPRLSGTGKALELWYESRIYPYGQLRTDTYLKEYNIYRSASMRSAGLFPGQWEAIGPKNFGGRTLCLTFNPQNPETIFIGTASGGLWRSYSEGVGAEAWHEVATGFPVIGVGAIAINPADSNEIYIGTGEVYNYQNTGTGYAVRTTRGTYGIGILKSTDGGQTWSSSLTWQLDDLTGVQGIAINPANPSTVIAATTEGIYRSHDGGGSWTNVLMNQMGVQVTYMPGDTSVLLASCGNSGTAGTGIYRSADGGTTWNNSSAGIPSGLTGKIHFDIAYASPNIVIASVADQLTGRGLYRSVDLGNTWTQVNNEDFQKYQGWYSHDVAVDPYGPSNVICAGIDVWKSTDGGSTLGQKSLWYNWDFNAVTPGGSEGPPDYVHADVHAIEYYPQVPGVIYFATDGGVFRSLDNGDTFEGVNGGLQNQQFYANFSNSATDSLFGLGGMQDNATAVYEGNDGWRRVIGGDGLSTAVNLVNDQIVFGSSQYLNVRRSSNKAQSFSSASVPGNSGNTCFAGPYEMSESDPDILYAGRTQVYRTVNSGNNWNVTNSGNTLDGNPVLTMDISSYDPDKVYAATAPVNNPSTGLFKTTDGGLTWSDVFGTLPDRYIMDIVINPAYDDSVYVVVSGFGTPHLYLSADGGATWQPHGTGLPDVPSNTMFIDPMNTNVMYFGNDIGVYASIDAGLTWVPYDDGLTDATFVMHISHSPSNRKLRIATHGNGVWQRDMLPVTITGIEQPVSSGTLDMYPNPAREYVSITIPDGFEGGVVSVYTITGSLVATMEVTGEMMSIRSSDYTAGDYIIHLRKDDVLHTGRFTFISE
jgi:photosystem II stability/assembly factor-like uncharacterized protein